MPRVPKVNTYHTESTSANAAGGLPEPHRDDSRGGEDHPLATTGTASGGHALRVALPELTAAPLPRSIMHNGNKASAVYKFQHKGHLFPGVQPHRPPAHVNDLDSGNTTATGGPDAASSNDAAERKRHRTRDALARAHHIHFLKLCGKLPDAAPSTHLPTTTPTSTWLSGTLSQRDKSVTTTTESALPHRISHGTDSTTMLGAGVLEDAELIFGTGTCGLYARARSRTSTRAPSSTTTTTATRGTGQTCDALPAVSGSAAVQDTGEVDVFTRLRVRKTARPVACHPSSVHVLPRCTPTGMRRGRSTQRANATPHNASESAGVGVAHLPRLGFHEWDGSRSCHAGSHRDVDGGPPPPLHATRAAGVSASTTAPLEHAGSHAYVRHEDDPVDLPQGGVMDVFGYFATHRIEPEYYERLRAAHEERCCGRPGTMNKTLNRLAEMRTITVD